MEYEQRVGLRDAYRSRIGALCCLGELRQTSGGRF
jgi:hypothetical protein